MKLINKKRLLSLAMAGTLSAVMAVPAFAAGRETTITGTYKDVTIEVIVPTTGAVQINPYGLDVEITGTTPKVNISGQQIVTQPLAVINKSRMNLSVDVSVTTKLTGDNPEMTLATESTKKLTGSDLEKSAFVYFQMGESTLAQADMKADGTGLDVQKLAEAYSAWEAEYTAASDVVLSTEEAVVKENVITLAAGTANETDNTKTDVAAGGVGLFRLSGDCVSKPATEWKTTDGFETKVAFSFSVAAE